jgi:flagellar basal-body rod protein FlgC
MTIPPITSPILPQRPEAPRPMFSALAISASGLSAQRARMDIIAQNLATAETTRTPQGGPYQRHIVNLEPVEPQATAPASLLPPGAGLGAGPGASAIASLAMTPISNPAVEEIDTTGGVRVASITQDKTDGPMVYDPGNPDADKNGYVHMPNVNMTDELMDLMNARRIYEANATVFQAARAMLHKAIDI